MLTRRNLLLSLAAAGGLRATAPTNWPQFRGPGARGTSEEDTRLPHSWSDTENVAWKTDVAGYGWSSPVVWGDDVFLTAAIPGDPIETPKKGLYFGGNRAEPPKGSYRWVVHAVDFASGKTRWSVTLHEGVPKTPRHLKNTYASETPVTDGERVYAHFGDLGTYCLDLQGKLLWSKPWPPYPTRYAWGTAASPALHQGRLYVVNDNDEDSFLVALDKKTGKEIWRVRRDEKSNWATPHIWENERRTEIITCGTNRTRSYDLDGKLLWEFAGMSSIVIPTPFSLMVCSMSRRDTSAMKPAPSSRYTQAHPAIFL